MKISDLEFDLPEELIAQEPLADRSGSRMLSVDRTAGSFSDHRFYEFPGFLTKDDVVVFNDTRVFPARLVGTSDTGGKIELFLLEDDGQGAWTALARPAKRLKPGKTVEFGGSLSAEVIANEGEGRVRVRFGYEGDFFEVLDSVGKTPLPHYIKRSEEPGDADRKRYQTIYAEKRGAIAAPTAGLHFDEATMDAVREASRETVKITLHVGYGTFEPIRVERLEDHRVLPERYEISEEAAEALEAARTDGRRIVAVGTTTTRALESRLAGSDRFEPGGGMADLTITPGFRFRAAGALLTNFHLPGSSLLMLVSTFAGHDLIMRAYMHAVAERYRFYSYGDCMFVS